MTEPLDRDALVRLGVLEPEPAMSDADKLATIEAIANADDLSEALTTESKDD